MNMCFRVGNPVSHDHGMRDQWYESLNINNSGVGSMGATDASAPMEFLSWIIVVTLHISSQVYLICHAKLTLLEHPFIKSSSYTTE